MDAVRGANGPLNGASDGAEDGAAAFQAINTHSAGVQPPVSVAARRPHEAEPHEGADRAERGSDDAYAMPAEDASAGRSACPPASVMAFTSVAEEVWRLARVQRQRRGSPLAWRAS